MYTYDQVFNASLDYFGGDELAASVFATKYALQNLKGEFIELTPADMHRRLAKELVRIENQYSTPLFQEQDIFDLLDHFKYIVPQGSPMSGIGNSYQIQSISNCFVIPAPKDSYGGILYTDQQQAQIMKRRGGVGFDISSLRPRGTITNNAAKTTTGLGTFMERFSNTCREVAQEGRRGALMLTCSVHSKDIETFINIKRDRTKVTGANISVRVTDRFMNAVLNDEETELEFDGVVIEKVKARKIWEQIIDSAWESAEPGVLFWDTILKNSVADIYADEGYKTVSTNPCGEITLSEYDSCRLTAINVFSFVENPFTPEAYFNFNKFLAVAQQGQRLMDNMVDIEIEQIKKIIEKIKKDPEPEEVKSIEFETWKKILKAAKNGRRTGLGMTGIGDAIAACGFRYGSQESIDFVNKVAKHLAVGSYVASIYMAKERGAFGVFNYEKEKNHPFIKKIKNAIKELYPTDYKEILEMWEKYGRRNIACNTIAPTGSLSTQTMTTSGIEPPYKLFYVRRKKINPSDESAKVDFIDELGDKWQEFKVYHHGLTKWMEITGEKNIEKSPYFQSTAEEIDWKSSVLIQAAAQEYIDHSISKTCNLPNDVSKETVEEVYKLAWESGCKGFTIYREGSRSGVLVSAKEEKEKKEEGAEINVQRPETLSCDIHRIKIGGEPWVCFVSMHNNRPYEIFTGLDSEILPPSQKLKTGAIVKRKSGSKTMYDLYFNKGQDNEVVFHNITAHFKNESYAAQSRLISLSLRHNIPVHFIVDQLNKIDGDLIHSFNKVISRVLKTYIAEGVKYKKVCPNCNSKDSMMYQDGCLSCSNCGYSKC